jgi:hypothetical protein
MSKGNRDYFRHSFHARNDDKIRAFGALLGRQKRESYFYYFTLIELCASMSEDGQTVFKIHTQVLREMWMTDTQGAHNMCKRLASVALLMLHSCSSHVVVEIPNLPKYLGKYKNKESKNALIKRNEMKRNEMKINTPTPLMMPPLSVDDSSVDSLIEIWNKKLVPLGLPYAPLTLGRKMLDQFFILSARLAKEKKTWEWYVNEISKSDFLIEEKKIKTTFNWALNEENFDKILSGNFSTKNINTKKQEIERDRHFRETMGLV